MHVYVGVHRYTTEREQREVAGTVREVGLTGSATSWWLTWTQSCCWEEATQGHDRLSLPSPLHIMQDSPAPRLYGAGGSAGHHRVLASICLLTLAHAPRTEPWEDSPPRTWPEADTPDSRSLTGLRLLLVMRHELSCCSQLDRRARCEGLGFIVLECVVPLIQRGLEGKHS